LVDVGVMLGAGVDVGVPVGVRDAVGVIVAVAVGVLVLVAAAVNVGVGDEPATALAALARPYCQRVPVPLTLSALS
jgi:hypothetical protein